MPIALEHRRYHPINWHELPCVVRFTRAQGRCEHWGRPHGQQVMHLDDGTWWDAERGAWRDGHGKRVRKLQSPDVLEAGQQEPSLLGARPAPGLPGTHVVLASAHLDHDRWAIARQRQRSSSGRLRHPEPLRRPPQP